MIDEYTTVIVEVMHGTVTDYYAPDGIHVIIVDHDVIREQGRENTNERILSAMQILEDQRK